MEDHGVGIIAIYENTNSCPYVAINLSEGLDAVSKSKPAPAGPNGALHCSEFPAANVARTFDWATVVGGIAPWTPPGKTEEEPRPADIWFATGNGTPPTDIIDANLLLVRRCPIIGILPTISVPYPLGLR
ncbi:hypothetical protein KFU94_36150 [Chloroflexi bacterium TSY]|nr:hypothetical protein [Chloroflexi bacterium TSY]